LIACLRAQEERVESYPDGSVKARYQVDAQGHKDGRFEAFATNGQRTILATYRAGKREGSYREWTEDGRNLRDHTFQADVLHGRCIDWHPDGRIAAAGDYRKGKRHGAWTEHDLGGERSRNLTYRDGLLNGPVKILRKDKALSRQTWHEGELVQLDDIRPFPVRRETLREELLAILDARPASLDAQDPLAAKRHEALRRLQAYRRLCGLPHEELSLVPEWNVRCDAAAEVCRRLGRLEQTATWTIPIRRTSTGSATAAGA
jgi:hypothetical protein